MLTPKEYFNNWVWDFVSACGDANQTEQICYLSGVLCLNPGEGKFIPPGYVGTKLGRPPIRLLDKCGEHNIDIDCFQRCSMLGIVFEPKTISTIAGVFTQCFHGQHDQVREVVRTITLPPSSMEQPFDILQGQTWMHVFASASADWLLTRERIIEGCDLQEKVPSPAANGEKPRGGGGLARAFISDWLREHSHQELDGKKERLLAAHAAFRQCVSDGGAELDKYRIHGTAGTLAHRAGGVAFGTPSIKSVVCAPPLADVQPDAWQLVCSEPTVAEVQVVFQVTRFYAKGPSLMEGSGLISVCFNICGGRVDLN